MKQNQVNRNSLQRYNVQDSTFHANGVAKQNEDYPWLWTQGCCSHEESSSHRDGATSARDARATRSGRGGANGLD